MNDARTMKGRLTLWLALGLAAWVAAYRLLSPVAEWLTYGLFRLERGEHLSRAWV